MGHGRSDTAANMLNSTALSTANYNKMLYSWAFGSASDGVANGSGTGVVTDDVVFGASPTKYSDGLPAEARAALVERGWQITDGGVTNANVPNPPTGRMRQAGRAETCHGPAPPQRPSPATNPTITYYTATAYQGTPPALVQGRQLLDRRDDLCQITGLNPVNGNYYYSAIAHNEIGDSDPSQIQAPATTTRAGRPEPDGSAKVGWIPQPTTGGDPISYQIKATPVGPSAAPSGSDTCPPHHPARQDLHHRRPHQRGPVHLPSPGDQRGGYVCLVIRLRASDPGQRLRVHVAHQQRGLL